jgi:hypothetical protein
MKFIIEYLSRMFTLLSCYFPFLNKDWYNIDTQRTEHALVDVVYYPDEGYSTYLGRTYRKRG